MTTPAAVSTQPNVIEQSTVNLLTSESNQTSPVRGRDRHGTEPTHSDQHLSHSNLPSRTASPVELFPPRSSYSESTNTSVSSVRRLNQHDQTLATSSSGLIIPATPAPTFTSTSDSQRRKRHYTDAENSAMDALNARGEPYYAISMEINTFHQVERMLRTPKAKRLRGFVRLEGVVDTQDVLRIHPLSSHQRTVRQAERNRTNGEYEIVFVHASVSSSASLHICHVFSFKTD